MSKILSQSQAEAIYSAMCALNNVGGRVTAEFGGLQAYELSDGSICVQGDAAVRNGAAMEDGIEAYDSQSAFAQAYGLQTGA